MRYMLDTNIIVYAMNARPAQVILRLREHDPFEICVSSITLAELEFGACRSQWPARNRMSLLAFLSPIAVVSFDANAAREYGIIRADLAKKGTPIGGNDLLIAAHAKALGLTLVTNNVKEFARVAGLALENWAE